MSDGRRHTIAENRAAADATANPTGADGISVNARDVNQLFANSNFTGTRAEARQAIIDNGTQGPNGNFYAGHSNGEQNAIAANWQAGQQQQQMEDFFSLQGQLSAQNIQANVDATNQLIEDNIARFPRLAEVALGTVTGTATQLNEFMSEQFTGMLDALYPAWRDDIIGAAGTAQEQSVALTAQFNETVVPRLMESMDTMSAQALSNVEAQLRGEINPDVAAALSRNAAYVSQSIGVRGQAAQFLTARDFGLTSMDLQERGLANAQAAAAVGPGILAQTVQALQTPVQTGIDVTNLTSAYRPPQTDVSALYTNTQSLIMGQGAVSPNTAYMTNAQIQASAGSLVSSQLQFSQQMASQNYWNEIGLNMQQQANAAAGGNTFGMIAGAVIGGVVSGGNPAAISAGASAGRQL